MVGNLLDDFVSNIFFFDHAFECELPNNPEFIFNEVSLIYQLFCDSQCQPIFYVSKVNDQSLQLFLKIRVLLFDVVEVKRLYGFMLDVLQQINKVIGISPKIIERLEGGLEFRNEWKGRDLLFEYVFPTIDICKLLSILMESDVGPIGEHIGFV